MSHTKCYIQTGINLGKTRVTSCIEWFQFFIIDSVTVKASKSLKFCHQSLKSLKCFLIIMIRTFVLKLLSMILGSIKIPFIF